MINRMDGVAGRPHCSFNMIQEKTGTGQDKRKERMRFYCALGLDWGVGFTPGKHIWPAPVCAALDVQKRAGPSALLPHLSHGAVGANELSG